VSPSKRQRAGAVAGAVAVAILAASAARAADKVAKGKPAPSLAKDPRVVSAVELARTWLEGQRAYARIPGISAEIVHDQEVLWKGGFGQADVATNRPATADTVYSICSISKLFTSVAVMQQRDEGRLHLEDPVAKHLPWFQLKKTEGEGDVTIEGILTHASGLPREADYPYWSAPDFKFPTHEEVVGKISTQEALYAPEEHFQYSNLGLTLAGEIVSTESGLPYAEYVRKRILEPLGLRNTTPEMPEAERGKRLATGYTALDRDGQRRPLPFFTANGIGPAAGYASNVEDLGRFASWQFRLLQKGGTEVLKATSLKEMQRVHWAEPDFKTLWGLGFAIWRDGDKTFVGHGGSCPGYRTQILLMPGERIATVVMANAQGVDVNQWAQRLYDIVAPAIRDAVKDPGKGKATDPSLRRYVGTYDVQPWAGEVAIVPWEEGLAMIELPTMDPVEGMDRFRKVGENRFRRIRKDDSLGEEIVFELGPDGRATRFTQHSNHYARVGSPPNP
jgi:CubicO group peptidase (beta-lactamase class C family)